MFRFTMRNFGLIPQSVFLFAFATCARSSALPSWAIRRCVIRSNNPYRFPAVPLLWGTARRAQERIKAQRHIWRSLAVKRGGALQAAYHLA